MKINEVGDGYFPLLPSRSFEAFKIARSEGRGKSLAGSPEEKKKTHHGQTGEGRRKSSSGSSLSSQSSGKLSRGTMKQTNYGA
jgi:hypothetical protein